MSNITTLNHGPMGPIGLPAVLGGEPTWQPIGRVVWEDGEPKWDAAANEGNPNAILWPVHDARDAQAVSDVVDSGVWSYHGPVEARLEARMSMLAGGLPVVDGDEPLVDGSIALGVINGSFALALAYGSLMKLDQFEGITTPGRAEIIVPASTFQATAVMAAEEGLRVIVADTDADSNCLTVESVQALITANTRIIVTVPLYDTVADLVALWLFCQERGIRLVIDSAHAPFGHLDGVSFDAYADVVTGSGQGSKVVSPGEYGVALTRRRRLAAFMVMLRNCGRIPAVRPEWWPAEVVEDFVLMGNNLRADELSAGLLERQLDEYPGQQAHREQQRAEFAALMAEADLPFRLHARQAGVDNMFYKMVLVDETDLPIAALRTAVARQITSEVTSPYAPLCFPASGYAPESKPWRFAHLDLPVLDPASFPNAIRAFETWLCLPHEFWLRQDAAKILFQALLTLTAHLDAVRSWAVAS